MHKHFFKNFAEIINKSMHYMHVLFSTKDLTFDFWIKESRVSTKKINLRPEALEMLKIEKSQVSVQEIYAAMRIKTCSKHKFELILAEFLDGFTLFPHWLCHLQGCGNPVCVVLDRKPRRFRSLCHFVSYVAAQNRKNQVNFIQKGDCYDISIIMQISKLY